MFVIFILSASYYLKTMPFPVNKSSLERHFSTFAEKGTKLLKETTPPYALISPAIMNFTRSGPEKASFYGHTLCIILYKLLPVPFTLCNILLYNLLPAPFTV